MKVKIRKANLVDAKICLKLRTVEEKKCDIDFIGSVRNRSCLFLVAEKDGKVVGYCIGYFSPTQKKDVMLHETRIVKSERGLGIGTVLVSEFCKKAFRKKARAIYAEIESKHEKFYCKACGFKKNAQWTEVVKNKGK
ncbi:MAG TPA: GNAT family N-acetyltransferase [archaeon]|nr:GNAT family N-acetyltransferase [archaeon]